jgi:hypothetical protein
MQQHITELETHYIVLVDAYEDLRSPVLSTTQCMNVLD